MTRTEQDTFTRRGIAVTDAFKRIKEGELSQPRKKEEYPVIKVPV
jgi:hypothetical protein